MIQSVINHNGSGCSRSSFLANKSISFTWDKGRPPRPPTHTTSTCKKNLFYQISHHMGRGQNIMRALKSWLSGWYFSFYLRKEREMVIESEGSHQEKNGIFYAQADRKGWHCPPYGQFLVIFLLVCICPWIMIKADFTHEKKSFHSTTRIPKCSLLLLLCHKMVG